MHQVEGTNTSVYPNGSDFSFVINANKMKKLMEYNTNLYNVSSLPETYYRYFEVGLGFFITNGGDRRYAETYDFKKYGGLIGGAADPTLLQNASRNQYLQGMLKSIFEYVCMNRAVKDNIDTTVNL